MLTLETESAVNSLNMPINLYLVREDGVTILESRWQRFAEIAMEAIQFTLDNSTPEELEAIRRR